MNTAIWEWALLQVAKSDFGNLSWMSRVDRQIVEGLDLAHIGMDRSNTRRGIGSPSATRGYDFLERRFVIVAYRIPVCMSSLVCMVGLSIASTEET